MRRPEALEITLALTLALQKNNSVPGHTVTSICPPRDLYNVSFVVNVSARKWRRLKPVVAVIACVCYDLDALATRLLHVLKQTHHTFLSPPPPSPQRCGCSPSTRA